MSGVPAAIEAELQCVHHLDRTAEIRIRAYIDAMAAGEAKLRALHREDGGGCAHCIQPWPDDYQTWGAAKWPCETMKILDGIE